MAAAYATRNDLELSMGTALIAALYTEDADVASEDDDRIASDVASASAMTQLYALGKGYTVGDTLGTTTTDNLLKLATIGAIVQMAYSRGEKRVPLPENWTDHPARRAYTDLLNGDLPLPGASLESISAIGGWSLTETSDTNVDMAAPRRTSRRNMAGF